MNHVWETYPPDASMIGRFAMDFVGWYWCQNCRTILRSYDNSDPMRGLKETMERLGVDQDCEVHVVRVVMEV